MRNLMRDSVRAIRDMRFVSAHGDAVFTLGSIGTEKAMKVLLGCAAVEDEGRWPTKQELKDWGHDVEELSARLLSAIDAGLGRTTAKGYSAQLAARIRQSTVLPLLFAAFARYGRSGRFHHLDILATDEPGKLDEPSDYWDRIERHIRETRPEFDVVPYGDNAAFEDYQKRIRGFIADELDAWWFCVHRLGAQRCFGELGRTISGEIWEQGRPTPSAVKA
ncbi:hypothetical protein [Brachybacterium hainanense]|uniref:Uncharacterized protein n=1 Tax=Brachybacterium hainanense TaxID=1541174 RepID=A0ABV6RDW0_9MICO